VRRLELDNLTSHNLYLQSGRQPAASGVRALVLGEVIWDCFPDRTTRLGGAPLNFATHWARLGHDPRLITGVGADGPGEAARRAIAALGMDEQFVQTTARFATGTASVQIGPDDQPAFVIERPAAYDAVDLTDTDLGEVVRWQPDWIYYGTLFPSVAAGRHTLMRLLEALPDTLRFYDVNLRPGFESHALVRELSHAAHVVKLNEHELEVVGALLQLPSDPEGFCRAGASLCGWRAACVTLGARGCAMLVGGNYVEAPGVPVVVADTVGAGDAFATAFLHGIASKWPAASIAAFANRAGAAVASSRGALGVEIVDASPRVEATGPKASR
jgi:fructokinase